MVQSLAPGPVLPGANSGTGSATHNFREGPVRWRHHFPARKSSRSIAIDRFPAHTSPAITDQQAGCRGRLLKQNKTSVHRLVGGPGRSSTVVRSARANTVQPVRHKSRSNPVEDPIIRRIGCWPPWHPADRRTDLPQCGSERGVIWQFFVLKTHQSRAMPGSPAHNKDLQVIQRAKKNANCNRTAGDESARRGRCHEHPM